MTSTVEDRWISAPLTVRPSTVPGFRSGRRPAVFFSTILSDWPTAFPFGYKRRAAVRLTMATSAPESDSSVVIARLLGA
jgi:hypothetical protein